jgi:5'(3')-deoxyribonucleotidase
MSERKPRIAVDMDEVLADPIAKFIKLYNRDYNTPLDLKIAPGNELALHVPEHARMKVREYINEKGFFRDLDIMPGAVEVMRELQKKYEVFIASAAMEFPNSLHDKYEWLAEHFPFIGWQHIIFCGYKIVDVDSDR